MWLLQTLRWWALVEVIGLLALPLAVKLLRFLPERGVSFRRPLGLLLGGAFYWLLVTLGLLHNTAAGAGAALLLVGGLSLAAAWGQRCLIRRELARLRGYVILEAGVFLLALLAWSFFRAHNPEIAATEKPMEYAFLNGILRSPTFPPRDPWLAGYGISYYYFGYLLMAMLTLLSGLPSAVTFNLTGTLLLALTVSGSLGLVYNLVCAARDANGAPRRGVSRAGALLGLLGATLAAVMGNLVGLLELIRARGWGGAAFWQFWDVRGLGASAPSPTWYPEPGWWWRASRVIHNRDLAGNIVEVISEFPFFSFLLGDNHPHVLALPFVLLALALALNLLLSRDEGQDAGALAGLGSPPALLRSGLGRALAGLWGGGAYELLLWGVILGALGFLNTWDYPIYLALFVAAYALLAYRRGAAPWGWLARAAQMGAALLAVGLLAYLPFYLGFRSQAGGIGLVPAYTKTPWQQFALMFGVQLVVLSGLLAVQLGALWRNRRICPPPWSGILWEAACWIPAVAVALLGWYTAALGLFLLGLSGGLLLWGSAAHAQDGDEATPANVPEAPMALLMATVGLALVVSVEFVFLRDVFGTRMNTVFKFYYQGWLLLSLAAAYGVYHVWVAARRARWHGRIAAGLWATASALLILAGLTYPAAATVSKADAFRGAPTLDGARYLAQQRPDEYAAIQWLQEHAPPDAVLVEAPGGSYTVYNRISAHTGIPTLLGWGSHQLQWRGSYAIPGAREPDIEAIYRGRDPAATLQVLQRYGVDYVIVGPLERAYGADATTLDKLERLMAPVYANESIVIYARTW
jgi:YYY domain-containing protein